MKGFLVLENGQVFEGTRIGVEKDTICEVVFNTAMAGYIETFTDPSYAGQGIVMTYPLIGNYGVMREDYESAKIWAKAVFVHEIADFPSNFRTEITLNEFLVKNEIPGLTEVNTRKLTRVLREAGTMRGMVTSKVENKEEILKQIQNYVTDNLVEQVTVKEKEIYKGSKEIKIALLDFGCKKNIVNSLVERGAEVVSFPMNTKAEEIVSIKPDGIVLSNGPGDPEDCKEAIKTIQELYQTNIPILGICLGHQLMGIATGAKTAKLKYGHRGPNHPVKEVKTDRTYITSQNHGYYIVKESVNPEIAEISYTNLNDDTVEGLTYKNKQIVTVQFHPEACPGPEDTSFLFDNFINEIEEGKKNA